MRMKKLLLFAFCSLLALPTMAQDEDVTHYIQNAGFDADLTFQADGSMKEIQSTTTSLSDRSWAYIATDSSVYAKPKESSSQQRKDGRSKLDATNGFIGRVQGWTVETNQVFPKCEWVYFGTVPYALGTDAVPIADDGDTYLLVPEKPAGFTGDDNVGFAYLRAGWGGRAVYKQVVKLPCAKYRLEYWAININSSASKGKNLSEVVCRKDHFKDETGFNDTEWTKHTIEFTPTAEFSMSFGFESEGGSGSNPFLCIDGIKLYKIGEADPAELLQSLAFDCQDMSNEAMNAGYAALAAYIGDYSLELEEMMSGTDEEMIAALTEADKRIDVLRAALDEMPNVDDILAKMDNLIQTTDYAGKAELEAAYARILGYKQNENYEEGTDVPALILGAVAEATLAIQKYYMSQEASEDNPADYTFLIQHPWFINDNAEPVWQDDAWYFPMRYDSETGEDRYVDGSASSPDLNSEGWEITGISGGDQRLNWVKQRSCWNAWASGFTGAIAVGQTIENLPNGYYAVAADLITQYVSDQHVYAQSTADKKISTQTLSTAGWDDEVWETISMTKEDKVLVVDGKLTIGAEGTGTGDGATGWFCATNFKLYYMGAAPAEAYKAAFDARLAEAKDLAAEMKFAADKKVLNDSIAKYETTTDYVAGITALAVAIADAQKSQAKYFEYLPEDETTEGKTLYIVRDQLAGEGYGAAQEIMQYAYNYVMNWIVGDTATYVYFDATVDLLKNYLNTYTPAVQDAAKVADAAKETGKAYLQGIINNQKAVLTAKMQDKATVEALVAELKTAAALVNKQNIVDDTNAKDYTAFIINPNMEAETGWEFNKGNGNTNTAGGQWYYDTTTRYIDSYHSEDKTVGEETQHIGLQNFIASQLVKDLPNGTYQLAAYTRTPAEGAYVFQKAEADTVFAEIPMNYYTYTKEEDGQDTTVVASDAYGPIWEEAKAAAEAGTATEDQYIIAEINDGKGRGWQHQVFENIKVTNHELLIGTMTGTALSATPKVFAGNWYSVGGWTLTLIEMGDNTGWGGPIAEGIETVKSGAATVDGIYTLTGVKTNKLQRGLNIVIRNGKAQKVLIK